MDIGQGYTAKQRLVNSLYNISVGAMTAVGIQVLLVVNSVNVPRIILYEDRSVRRPCILYVPVTL